MKLHLRFINLDKLLAKEKSAPILVRLMFAFNDISAANMCMARILDQREPMLEHMFRGVNNYLIRLQSAHLREAIDLIDEIGKSGELLLILQRCSVEAKEDFKELQRLANEEPPYGNWKKSFIRIRNRLAFHYSKDADKDIVKALSAKSIPSRIGRVTRAWNNYGDRFDVADDVMDAMMFHQIMDIPPGNILKHGEPLIEQASKLCLAFIRFSGEFIHRYLDDVRA